MMRGCVGLLLACAAVFGHLSLDALVDCTGERARVLAKGYGLRRLGSAERTMVGMGSNTKAFSSAALAMLMDEKKLSWDDGVIDRVPEFALFRRLSDA